MSNWWEKRSLGEKYGMGLAVLVFLVASYGVFKLWLQKRRTKKITRALEAKALDEEGRMEQAWLKCTDAEVEEGDLFGIRAIERGFYGGVAQSRGPTPSATSVSSATLGRIPYGKDASRGIAANPSTIALDPGLGLGHGPGPSPPKAGATSKPLPAASAAADTCLRVPESPRVHPAQPAVSSPLLHGSTLSGSSVSTLGLPEEAVSESAGSGGGGGDDGCRSGIRQPPGPAVAKPPRAARPASPGFPLRKYLDPLPHPSAAIALALGDPAYPPGPAYHAYASSNSNSNSSGDDTIEEIGDVRRAADPARASTVSFDDLYDSYYDPRRLPAAGAMPLPAGTDEGTRDHRYSRGPSRALM